MLFKKLLAFCFFTIICQYIAGIEKTDTLYSTKNDRIIISYDVIREDGKVSVRFLNVRKRLGKSFSDKYKKLDEVEVFLFDRTGNYEDIRFSGLAVNAFMIPANARYNDSVDGYFMLKDTPSLQFNVLSDDDFVLSIPIYLAHYEKKKHYRIFTQCGNLLIKAGSSANKEDVVKTHSEKIVISEIEETGMSEVEEANIRMNRINDLLHDQRKLPISDELSHEISMLRELRYKINDRTVLSHISVTLTAFDDKKRELEEKADSEAKREQDRAEAQAKLAMIQEQARQDSIAAVSEQIQRDEKRQNMWMLIGGVCLAALAFVGNQFFQFWRNKKNQQDLMNMQQTVVERAEAEAKNRAKRMARDKSYQIARDSEHNLKNLTNKKISKYVKDKKKGVSI